MLLFSYFNSDDFGSETYITRSGYVGTLTYEDLDYVMTLKAQGDDEAVNKLYQQGIFTEVPAGVEVYVEESKFSVVKIRLKGTTQTLWTVIEAIKH